LKYGEGLEDTTAYERIAEYEIGGMKQPKT
jgi:hypothetical protein